ncbi:hypothetical protein HID58_070881, partial [Brassica napus]
LSSLEMAAVIDWISFCSVFESWGKYTRQIRRIEGFIFSNLKRIHPANPFDFADVFPANLAIPENLLRDVNLSPLVNSGEMQSFLKPPWPGNYDIAFIVHLLSSESVMTFTVQKRIWVLEETMFTGIRFGYSGVTNVEMMSQGYETMVVNFSLQAVIRWRGYWRMWKQSWHRRTSVSLGGRDKQKTTSSVYWSHKRSIIESTLKQITRIWANWYRVDISNYVLDTMAFYCTIWKKNEMSKWHTYCIRDSQILEKENNRLHIMLTCKAYCKRKQRHSSLLQIISLQHMSHISAY